MSDIGDNGSVEALKAFADRLENLESQRMAISADIKALGEEITSAGFSHRVLKRIVKAKIAEADGRPKPLASLREEAGDLDTYVNVLVPEQAATDAAA